MDMLTFNTQALEQRPEQMSAARARAVIDTAMRYEAYVAEDYPPTDDRVAISDARLLVGYARVITRMGLAGREQSPGVSTAILEAFQAPASQPWRDYSGARG